MKFMITTAFGLVAAVAASTAAAQNYGTPAPPPQRVPNAAEQQQAAPETKKGVTPSSKALKAILDLQATVNNNDYANVPAKVAAAQAVATTKEDRYLIGQFQLKAAVAAKDNAAVASAIDTIASSGVASTTDVAQLYMALGSTYFDNKQFDQAAAAFQRGAAADPNNTDLLLNLGETRYSQGQKAQAAAIFQQVIDKKLAAGQKPDEALYHRAWSVAYDAQLPAAAEIARQWAGAYPSPGSWHDSIAVFRNVSHQDVEGTLDLLRLMQATNSMQKPSDYSLFITASADQGNYNEAQKVLDEGIAAHVVSPSDPDFRDIIAGLKAKPKATPADLVTAAKSAQSGMALLHIGDRYYAMGDYAKAAELYRTAMTKPGVDSAVANLHIGMALARAGDRAGAVAALNAVTGPRAEIAKFWLTYVNQRG